MKSKNHSCKNAVYAIKDKSQSLREPMSLFNGMKYEDLSSNQIAFNLQLNMVKYGN